MQKENPVIKNYILSSEKYILKDKEIPISDPIFFEIYLYYKPLKQNKA